MSSIFELISGQLDSSSLSQISQAIGADEGQTKGAIAAALPALLEGLSRNVQSNEGASALHNALGNDHDGSVLDNIQGFFGSGGHEQPRGGMDILKHVFGSKEETAASGVGQASGIGGAAAKKLLGMLAPLVLGALGRKKQESGMSAEDLSGYIKQEREVVEQASPKPGLIGKLLDQDGDGDFDFSDIAKVGLGKLGGLGGLLGGK